LGGGALGAESIIPPPCLGECFGLDGVTVSNAERLPPPRTLVEFELSDDVEEEEAVAGGIKGYGTKRCAFSRSESKATGKRIIKTFLSH
jgi:hypothetical protein